MSSEFPLASQQSQSYRQGEGRISRVYRNIPIRPGDPEAYLQLSTLSPALPQIGQALAGTQFVVGDVAIRPIGSRTDVSDVVITYSNRPNAGGGVATVQNQPSTEVTFELSPFTEERAITSVAATPVNTETVELDQAGMPTTEPPTMVGVAKPELSLIEKTLIDTKVRATFTVTGTAAALGVPSGFGFGTIPLMLVQQNKIHEIGGVPLLYQTGTIRKTVQSQVHSSGNVFAITHEWIYDPGVTWEAIPGDWAENPELGPAGGKVTVSDTLGAVDTDADGNSLSGVFVPYIAAPAQIAPLFGEGNKYIVPPHCGVDHRPRVGSDFPYPAFIPRPIYRGVDVDAWQNFPGVTPFVGGP